MQVSGTTISVIVSDIIVELPNCVTPYGIVTVVNPKPERNKRGGKDEVKDEIKNVKMAKVSSESKVFEKVSEADLENYSKNVSKFSNE